MSDVIQIATGLLIPAGTAHYPIGVVGHAADEHLGVVALWRWHVCTCEKINCCDEDGIVLTLGVPGKADKLDGRDVPTVMTPVLVTDKEELDEGGTVSFR